MDVMRYIMCKYKNIKRHMKKCTEIEANRVLSKSGWKFTRQELEKFIGIVLREKSCWL